MSNGFCNSYPIIDPMISRNVGFPAVLINGVFHRAPGIYSVPSAYSSESYQNLVNPDVLEKNKELEDVPSDPFLKSLDHERFDLEISITDEEYLDERLTRVNFEDLVQEDFKFLCDPSKILLDISRRAERSKEESAKEALNFNVPEIPTINTPSFEEDKTESAFQGSKTLNYRIKTKATSTRGVSKKKEVNNNEINYPKNPLKGNWSRPRGIQAPLKLNPELLARVNQGTDFVGLCCELKVNPFYNDCTGRISISKDDEGNRSLHCDNCSTRRRYIPEIQ